MGDEMSKKGKSATLGNRARARDGHSGASSKYNVAMQQRGKCTTTGFYGGNKEHYVASVATAKEENKSVVW